MKIDNLSIERKASYDDNYPNMLVGLVQMKGDHGKIEVKLSSKTVGSIFELIKEDVARVAKYNASESAQAVEEAVGEARLLSQSVAIDAIPF